MNACATRISPGHEALVSAFDAALAEGRSEIHYQPVLDADTGDVSFVEALFRCPDLGGAHISNAELMPALKDGARLRALTEHVVLRVLDQGAKWRERGLVECISLNLPMELLEDQQFLWWLVDEVVGSEIPPANILLELSGHDFADDSETVKAGIRRLAFAGFRLALDVPALEFSDLASLGDWTLHLLKVNRGFLKDPRSLYGRSLLSALYGVCNTLDLEWSVVGVENAEELEILKTSGARAIQGFHLAPPMDPTACTAWLGGRTTPTFGMIAAGHC
jgi:EAL domain-containing protein (putative c-di-GMP-specific phosphodiesterase class I)